MKKIVVTGGAGFIGSNIVAELNKLGHDNIIIVDSFSVLEKYRYLRNLRFEELIHKDRFLNELSLRDDIELVLHQGACSSTTESDGEYLFSNNYFYSVELLKYAVSRQIPFLYASSASVYGDGKAGFAESGNCEDPLNMYAYSKWLFDEYVRKVIKSSVCSPVIGLRYFNVYGYNEDHKGRMASVVHKFYDQVQQCKKIALFEGSQSILRDFIFSGDVVKIILFHLSSAKSGIYNCGTGKARSFMDIARCYQLYFPETEIQIIPFPEDLRNKYQYFTQADPTYFMTLNYNDGFTPLEEGVQSVIRYRQANTL